MPNAEVQNAARSSGVGASKVTRSNERGIPRRYGLRRGVGLLGAAVFALGAGCSATDDPISSDDTVVVPETVTEEFSASTIAPATSTIPPIDDGPLAGECPQQIAIQTASLPGPDVGPLYALLGDDREVDVETQTVTAPLVRTDGTFEDVELQLRSGGPAVGFRSPLSLLSSDQGLLLAQVSTAVATRDAADAPSLGVVSLTDRSRDSIIVDPATYPGVESMEAVRDARIEVRHVTDEPFIAFLTATGTLSSDQLEPGFDGEPAAFVQSDGAIAQQGDLLVEPVLLPALPQWGRPVTAVDAASEGWAVHDDALVARPSNIQDLRTCFGRLVPVIQSAIAAYLDDSASTNALMSDLRSRFAPLNRLTPDLMDAGVAAGAASGVFGDGANSTVGDFDLDRLESFLPELAGVFGVESIAADELMTNEFIDPSITSAG